jgi:hypothetical protein
MKSQFVRVGLLSALMLTGPLLSFAGDSHVIRVPSNVEKRDRSGITRAVQQGKGSGTTRNEGVSANAYREQTPAEKQVVKEKPVAAHVNWGDPAFHR